MAGIRFWIFSFCCAAALSVCGCSGGDTSSVPSSTTQDVEVATETSQVDDIIKAIDDAMTQEAPDGSVAVLLQENIESLREAHPDKSAAIDELSQLANQIANGAGKPAYQRAKAKLQELK